MVLLREAYSPPFKVAVPSAADLRARLQGHPGARVVAFHLAEHGSFEVRRGPSETMVVGPGESAFCFGEQPHFLAQGSNVPAVEFAALLETDAARVFGPVPDRRADQVRIVCGALILHDTLLNPLFSSLPEVLHVRRGGEGAVGRVPEVTALLSAELEREDPAAEYVVERLLEVLCAEGIRRFAAEQQGVAGWFHGLADYAVHRALAAFHARPGRDWSIARLAQIVNLSPSRFAARFAAATGESVMAYVTRWRMNLAMRSLSGTQVGVAAIASKVGYESLPAFSRAFKRHVGLSPATYRVHRSQATDKLVDGS